MPFGFMGRAAFKTIMSTLLAIQEQGKISMSKIDDLNTSVTAIKDAFAAYDAAMSAKVAALQQAHQDDDTAAVEASVSAINDLRASMKAKIDALAPATPPAADASGASADSATGTTAAAGTDTLSGADSVAGSAAADTIGG